MIISPSFLPPTRFKVPLLSTAPSILSAMDINFLPLLISISAATDETGFIGCASKTGEGSLAYKVGDNVCKDQSKYEVTGYISEIQGNPELKVISYRWDQNMQTSWNPSTYTKGTTSIEDFYEEAASINYNCQGHGYGEVYTLKNLYC